MNFFTTSILALVCFYVLLVIVVFFFQGNLLYHPSVNSYIKDKEDVSTIKQPINYAKPSGDRDFKSLEYKRW